MAVNIDNLSLVFNTNDGDVHALQDIDFKISQIFAIFHHVSSTVNLVTAGRTEK